LFWGDVPDATALVGMALIVGSGVFIILRTERLRVGAPPAEAVAIDRPSGRSD
jgi:hypothetical protein